jgi:hypothetical protein
MSMTTTAFGNFDKVGQNCKLSYEARSDHMHVAWYELQMLRLLAHHTF